jgi:AbrB family looped-hinge helix DNA binding protein
MNGKSRWLPVDEEGRITLPADILATLGWKIGEELVWIDNNDGSYSLKRPDIIEDASHSKLDWDDFWEESDDD